MLLHRLTSLRSPQDLTRTIFVQVQQDPPDRAVCGVNLSCPLREHNRKLSIEPRNLRQTNFKACHFEIWSGVWSCLRLFRGSLGPSRGSDRHLRCAPRKRSRRRAHLGEPDPTSGETRDPTITIITTVRVRGKGRVESGIPGRSLHQGPAPWSFLGASADS